MDVSLFDFELPDERIALRPASPRDSARLLVVHEDGHLTHAYMRDLPDFLCERDALVVNDTKVIPARLIGRRAPRPGMAGQGPKIETMLHKRT
ncbi:MAG TPA: S-adenosylmethionine:tRNA ribosyltransferase-isomerase, partial [Rhizomicrobium sp.]|nr:S-adenosylmethionine:tRNA ribosyltransferase-isomerase [Rhizomicrobium sp.]